MLLRLLRVKVFLRFGSAEAHWGNDMSCTATNTSNDEIGLLPKDGTGTEDEQIGQLEAHRFLPPCISTSLVISLLVVPRVYPLTYILRPLRILLGALAFSLPLGGFVCSLLFRRKGSACPLPLDCWWPEATEVIYSKTVNMTRPC